MSVFIKRQLCHELLPAYQNWQLVVGQAEEVKNEMLSVGTKSELEGMKKKMAEAEKEVNKAREEYEEVAYEEISYKVKHEIIPVVRKDAVLLASIEENVGRVERWHSINGRIMEIVFGIKVLSSGNNLYFPNSVQYLDLDKSAFINGNLSIPSSVKWLSLSNAILPENVTIPGSVQHLYVHRTIIKDILGNEQPIEQHQGFMQKLKELKQRNPNIEINGVNV